MDVQKIDETTKALTLGMTPEQTAETKLRTAFETGIRRIHAVKITEEREAVRKAGRIR